MGDIYTTEQAAKFLGVSQARIRQFILENRLPAQKNGRDHLIEFKDLASFASGGRKKTGRPSKKTCAYVINSYTGVMNDAVLDADAIRVENGTIHHGDVLQVLEEYPDGKFQLIVADPPYFQVLLDHPWDNVWKDEEEYLDWTLRWVKACKRVLRPDGLLYIFGQLGKREHVWLHTCSRLALEMQFHDMIIWDRAVGYNERYDSFTPQYEMILVLRQSAEQKPLFDKDAVRLPYDPETIQTYLRDKRYKDREARAAHLNKGKYATNILRVPSLKGSSNEKVGHPSQKPVALIEALVKSSSAAGQWVLDPFLGSGTTAVVCEQLKRPWVGIEAKDEYVAMSEARIRRLAGKREPEFSFG